MRSTSSRRRRRGTAALTVVLLLAGCSSSPAPSYSATIQEAQSAAEEALRPGVATSLAIGITDARGLIWAGGFGVADRATGAAPSDTTMFGIGSTSKLFATLAALQLVEQKLVDLDAPFVQYVPAFRMVSPEYRDVTVRMLLDHSSGLPGSDYRNAFTSEFVPDYPAQLLATLEHSRLKAAPGFMSVYCNDGFSLIELLVKARTGRDYARYVEEEILAPLQMDHTRFPLQPFAEGTYAKVYRDGVAQPQSFLDLLASGGLYSTPTDLAKFARVFLNQGMGARRMLAPASVAEMAVDRTAATFNPIRSGSLAYGLGWDSVAQPGLRAVGVAGWTKGGATDHYRAQLLVAPEAGLAVAVMGTAGTGFDPLAIAERVLLRALAENGRIAAFPTPVRAVPAPVAVAPPGLVPSMEGEYGSYNALYRLRAEASGSLRLDVRGDDGWSPFARGLAYRTDGWFTSDAAPLVSYKLVDGGGTPYLAQRGSEKLRGFGHQLDAMVFAQRVTGKGSFSPAWSARVDTIWVIANQSPIELSWTTPGIPAFPIRAIPELPGVIMAQEQLLDTTRSDFRAESFVVVPQMNGRDQFDLEVLPGDEARVRFGSFVAQRFDTLPVLTRGTSTNVAIGAEGFGEWRALKVATTPVPIRVTGATAWKIYGADHSLAAYGSGDANTALPAGHGPDGNDLGHVLVLARPGAQVGVAVE